MPPIVVLTVHNRVETTHLHDTRLVYSLDPLSSALESARENHAYDWDCYDSYDCYDWSKNPAYDQFL